MRRWLISHEEMVGRDAMAACREVGGFEEIVGREEVISS
jgi:hypothetical protein